MKDDSRSVLINIPKFFELELSEFEFVDYVNKTHYITTILPSKYITDPQYQPATFTVQTVRYNHLNFVKREDQDQ